LLTPCTVGNGWLRIFNWSKFAITAYDRTTFNGVRAWSLGRAIDSVLAQTCAPKEILVVDDGSTDHTPLVLADYGEKIRVLSQPNQGVSSARNTGIRHSTGNDPA
jgi:glycosyltransferase involved in cell wall biosynthesis